MESAERDILIEKVKEMSPEQVEKVLIFIAGLEAGGSISKEQKCRKASIKNNFMQEEDTT